MNTSEKKLNISDNEIDNIPILKMTKKKVSKYVFDDINKWFKFYKTEINLLFRKLLNITYKNGLKLVKSKQLFNDFVFTLYHNSYKNKIDLKNI